MNLCDAILQQAGIHPERAAIIEDERCLSYRQLARHLSRWSAGLTGLGLRSGDRLGICLRDSTDFVLAMLGAAHAGITIVPIDWRAPISERHTLATQFDLQYLMTEPGAGSHEVIPTVEVDDAWRSSLTARPTDLLPVDAGDTPLILKISSGTTGTPKGAIATHAGLALRLSRNLVSYGPMQDYRYLSVLPLCFSGGNNYVLFHLMSGSTVILYPTMFSADELVAAVRNFSADFLFAVPTVLRWLLEIAEGEVLLPTLRVLTTGTAQLSKDEKARVLRQVTPKLYEVYSTSAAGQISYLRPVDMLRHGESVGRPNPQMEVQIANAAGKPLAAGETGRIRCRGPGVSTDYYGNLDQSSFSERLEDGWCYTGDLGHLDRDGYLHVSGRVDDLIIRGGINIQPGVIEAALRSHPGVREAAVKGRASPALGQEVVAFVVPQADLQPQELLGYCRNRLAPHEIPAEIRFLESLPRTRSGKIQKAKLNT